MHCFQTRQDKCQQYLGLLYPLPNDYWKGQVCRKLCLAEGPTSEFWPKKFLWFTKVVSAGRVTILPGIGFPIVYFDHCWIVKEI